MTSDRFGTLYGMSIQQVTSELFLIDHGQVNSYLFIDNGEITVIDTGFPGSGEENTLTAINDLGYQKSDVKRIIVTHSHLDHAGGVSEIKNATGAPIFMHALDAQLIRQGKGLRASTETTPGFEKVVAEMLANGPYPDPTATEVEFELSDGEQVPGCPDLRAMHVPGHCAGQLALMLEREGGVLIAADAASIFGTICLPPIAEDLDTCRESLHRLASLDFEIAVFGHGPPVTDSACQKFQEQCVNSDLVVP